MDDTTVCCTNCAIYSSTDGSFQPPQKLNISIRVCVSNNYSLPNLTACFVYPITCPDSFAPALNLAYALGAAAERLLRPRRSHKGAHFFASHALLTLQHCLPTQFRRRKATSARRHQHQYGCKFANQPAHGIKLTIQATSFSAALRFTRELAFGVIAILGCIVIQCLILAWLSLASSQITLVLLQAKMLRRVYQLPSEKQPSVEKRPSIDTNQATEKAKNIRGNSNLRHAHRVSLTDSNSQIAHIRALSARQASGASDCS